MRIRLLLAIAGILLMAFGFFRLFTQVSFPDLAILALWLIGALVIHDGILSPIIVAIGWGLARVVPPRARRYVQTGLIVAGLVSVIALPLIYREGSQPAVKALLVLDYGGNLTLLLGLVAAGTLIAYAVNVARDHSASTSSAAVTGRKDTAEGA